MKRAIILINAYSQLKHSLNQSVRLKEELEKRGVHADIMNNNFFATHTDERGEIVNKLHGYDFCVYLDKDKYTSFLLEKSGMRLFNPHSAIEDCDDKMTTFARLAGNGIPMPETLPGLLCYDRDLPVQKKTLDEVEKMLGYPLIMKMCYGSLGAGVFKINNRSELEDMSEKLKCEPHLFQKFIKNSCGRDMRVIVVGGKCIAAMERVNENDFRSNIELNGKGIKIDPPEEVKKMCVKAAEILNLDYCGTDVLFGDNGYLLCEVNSNAFFGGIEAVTGINVGGAYADHMCRLIYGNK